MAVGLSILLSDQTYKGHPKHLKQHMIKKSMYIVLPVIKLSQAMITQPPSPVVELESAASCYLKSCHLCHKRFKPEDDIYMHKGDQGYCTRECRNKQIKMDRANEEKDEREAFMKNMSTRRQHKMMSQKNSAKCNETLLILRDLRHRRGPVHLQRNGGIFF